MKSAIRKIMGVVPALAMALAVSSMMSACIIFLHQPDIPEGLRKFEG